MAQRVITQVVEMLVSLFLDFRQKGISLQPVRKPIHSEKHTVDSIIAMTTMMN